MTTSDTDKNPVPRSSRKPVLTHTSPKRLLNPASGFLSGYTHTLNPYVGCAFSCSYCYVREMPVAKFRGAPWGGWVDIKAETAAQLGRELERAGRKAPVTVFMSSSTDPYQPAEYEARVTRSWLEAMADSDALQFVMVQTRSPLVTRDLDVLQRLGSRVRVSMTIETDLDAMRKLFSPAAPPIAARLNALRQLAEAGIQTQAAVSPLLPCSGEFAARLAATGVQRVALDDYFRGDGSLGRRTERLGIRELYVRHGLEAWYDREALDRVRAELEAQFGADLVRVSQEGFLP
ncbi:DNA repair photolyase [Paenibacillus sp. UNCCL117]|uniref:SPL family radical SAM protein n=1 Tax=unclassified Paenibacillus TaxID=185978 RepID=UPI0008810855|nr:MULTISPECIES: radical SAM protein [unclassified Paenibacillus]SDD79909.1 DNA repair photolyase [Paenibacillus sp. cl123]SFW53305.1 DNA repair photolyase [Paenibacillus sp. UNCCL117]